MQAISIIPTVQDQKANLPRLIQRTSMLRARLLQLKTPILVVHKRTPQAGMLRYTGALPGGIFFRFFLGFLSNLRKNARAPRGGFSH